MESFGENGWGTEERNRARDRERLICFFFLHGTKQTLLLSQCHSSLAWHLIFFFLPRSTTLCSTSFYSFFCVLIYSVSEDKLLNWHHIESTFQTWKSIHFPPLVWCHHYRLQWLSPTSLEIGVKYMILKCVHKKKRSAQRMVHWSYITGEIIHMEYEYHGTQVDMDIQSKSDFWRECTPTMWHF